LGDAKKMLLTATPLQNSLLELYGLTSLIDEQIFGDIKAFKSQYTSNKGDLDDLRERMAPFCKRTLRKDVKEYVPYTERKAMTQSYRSTDAEQRFYEKITTFLHRTDTYAVPKQQRHLMAIIWRKMLGSSTVAMLHTLEKILKRLKDLQAGTPLKAEQLQFDLLDDLSPDDELLEELEETLEPEHDQTIDAHKLQQEIREIQGFIELAKNIQEDSRTSVLIEALKKGFAHLEQLGAKRKALIFTESRRTQDYLKAYLESHGYQGKIVLFNGSNADKSSKATYDAWVNANRSTGKVTGSKAVDMRSALVDAFKNDAEIMIATEAGAEGVNLQFCSMVVNYDMPWNPQRVEQRIGRCHRYGQEHDVVVLNFVNQRNEVERRIFELLEQKFNLFDDVFGASDGVLGSIYSGVDFEKQVSHIFESCRTPAEIKKAFDALQKELETSIQSRMKETQEILLTHFDEDVHARLKLKMEDAQTQLSKISTLFWKVTQQILNEKAHFNETTFTFDLKQSPCDDAPQGRYHLINKEEKSVASSFLYRLSHPLGEWVLKEASEADLPVQEITFDITNHPTKISVVQGLKGKAGWLMLNKFRFETADVHEELLFTAITEDGKTLDADTCHKLFNCAGQTGNAVSLPADVDARLKGEYGVLQNATTQRIAERHNAWFKEENARIDRWEDDIVKPLNDELDSVKRQLKQVKRKMQLAEDLATQQDLSEEEMRLSKLKKRLRLELEEKEDEVEREVNAMRKNLKQRMTQKVTNDALFTLRWFVV
jgi:superfamily II DNA/RNA helicase